MEIQDNISKANEICKKHIFDSNHFDCCMEMAQWKDEQHKQEKQQWIEKACEWLKGNTDISILFIGDFKKEMKGE